MQSRPLIAVTCDVEGDGASLSPKVWPSFGNYLRAVLAAGGDPVPIGAWRALRNGGLDRAAIQRDYKAFDGFVFTGGGDPEMSAFGVATHDAAKPKLIHPMRQAYEMALLRELLAQRQEQPVLGVCLGCQLMALATGGTLDQHLPDSIGDAARAHGIEGKDETHDITPIVGVSLASGAVTGQHHQAIDDAGDFRVIARSADGVVEAIDLADHPNWLGVQWHPERTANIELGQALFDRFVAAASAQPYRALS